MTQQLLKDPIDAAAATPVNSARRIRVLMLVDQLDDLAGGAERFVVGLACALHGEELDVQVCSTRKARGELVSTLDQAGIKLLDLDRRGRWDLPPFRKLGQLLRTDRIDVLHAHKYGSNIWGTLLGRACGVPVVVAHEHNWSFIGQPIRRLLDGQLIGRLADSFVAVSDADRERMIRLERVQPKKLTVIPTPFIPRTSTAGVNLRTELGLSDDVPLVGTVAILRASKALDLLIDAFADILKEIPAARLVIAGDGPLRGELEAHAMGTGISDSVHFLGVRQDVDRVFRGLDVCAISSDTEGLPLAALECMSYGTPLVSTAVGGLPELIDHGENGLLVKPRDRAGLAQAIKSLLTDTEQRDRLAASAANKVQQFELPAIATRFADLYGELLANKKSPTRT